MLAKGTMLCLIIMILHIHQCLNLCIEHERQALLKIEKDIYDHDNGLSSWRKGGDCCNWQGITCHNTTGNVISLELYSLFGFKGTIPPQLGNLSSLQQLSIDGRDEHDSFGLRVDDLHWLSRLTSLTSLVMYYVDLSAAVDWFDDITKLPFISTISFWQCALSSIPMTMPSLNNFTFLQSLDLRANELNSTIPSWLLYNISSLEQLYIIECGLYGELPLLSRQVSNLKHLNLGGNNISASISETFLNLTYLDLSDNQIHGSLPKTLGNYNQLETILLDNNNVTGEIPHTIGCLYKLTFLLLDGNNMGGEIPQSIGNLYRLTVLLLGHNNIEGKIPDSIGNLKNLKSFDVSKNLLNGEVPHSLFNLTKLEYLDLSNNKFWGEVPKSINLNYLRSIDLSNNRLNGSIFFTNQSLLSGLYLSNNSFTGMFPIPKSITSQLAIVDLSNNRFSGTIPNIFMFHPFLASLKLGKNKFNGLIPSSVKYCKSLFLLDLSENKLHGKIPPWIGGTLLSLCFLSLRSNNLTGQIPRELSYLTSLQILDLSQNHISGNFSLHFDNFTVMTKEKKKTLPMIYNGSQLTNIWLTKEGFVRNYIADALQEAIVIDLSSNEISGEISNGITKLNGLKFLNLSRNHFTGNIPKNIGAIKDMETLDLSSNELSGEIPSTMAELTFLAYLNLSYNNLSGTIPGGNQFLTFNDSSYSGNSNLCGWPLPKCVGSNNNNTNFDGQENEEDEYWYDRTWINAGTVVGFLISSWGIFITLLFNQSMRRLHFYYVDKLYDLIGLQFHFGIAKIKSKFMEIEMH